MKCFAIACFAAVLAIPTAVRAQDNEVKTSAAAAARPASAEADEQEFTLGQMTPTPDMWFYEQYQRRQRDPKESVRRRAEFEADQRQARLAAQRWFGYSNSRPMVNTSPFTNTYSPVWTSNGPNPSQWRGVNRGTVIVTERAARGTGYGLW